jgi:glyoxylase-like metal-dependent hydrolase (beta-lactamase superfamily II)
MDLPVAARWFERSDVGGGVTMLTEPHAHAYIRANIWHVRGSDCDLVIDTGMGLQPLLPALDKVPGKPLLAVATHIHVDHVGSLHEFADRAGPRHSAAGFFAMSDEWTLAHMFRELEVPVSALPEPGWRAERYRIEPAPLTRILDEGDVVDLGDRRFTVLHLPGHSPDSIGLFDEKSGVLFSGDAIYDDALIDDLPGSDRAAYRRTMERLKGMPVSIAHGGHGPSFGRERLREIADGYLRDSSA